MKMPIAKMNDDCERNLNANKNENEKEKQYLSSNGKRRLWAAVAAELAEAWQLKG